MVIVVAGCLFGLAPQTLFLKLKPSGDVCRLTVMLGYGCNLFVFCHGNIFMVSKLVGLRACLVGESSVYRIHGELMPVAGCEPDGFSCFLAVRIFLSRCNSLFLLVIFRSDYSGTSGLL